MGFKSSSGSKIGNRVMTRATQKNPVINTQLLGEIFEGVVRDVVNSGNAILEHPSGLAVFVRGAWLGERVSVKITEVKNRFAQAVLLDVIAPCAERVSSPCEHFSPLAEGCGGCAWLFVNYAAQLRVKQSWVEKSFAELLNPAKTSPILPIVGSTKALGYRNRAEFKTDGTKLGFLATNSSDLIDVKGCPVLVPALATQLLSLRQLLPNVNWQQQKQPRKGKASPHYTLIAVDDDMPQSEVLVNQRLPFKQGNSEQNTALKQWLIQVLQSCDSGAPVLELFCGSGNFTEIIHAAGLTQIIAAELASDTLTQLREKKLAGVVVHELDLFDEAALTALCKDSATARTLVLDPPRDGLACIEPLLKHRGFKRIAYLSCDLATCTRDVKRFVAAGYKIKQIQPVDMFPNTPHLELCVFLSRA
ncbi:MAG: TRAM domain-containing protein [Marinagarivorans sp.]|nr:TRAM domain-containing protein [Marinagarivorans sp.]